MRGQKPVQKRSIPNKKRKKSKKAESFALPILTFARQIGSGARKTAILIPKGAETRAQHQSDFLRIYTEQRTAVGSPRP